MCAHPVDSALRAGGDALREAADALSRAPLSVEALRCAVQQARRLTTELADLTDGLADRAQELPVTGALVDQRPGSAPVDQTVREVVEDLRTAARHLRTGHLLLEPAEDDLGHLRPQIPAPAPPAEERPGVAPVANLAAERAGKGARGSGADSTLLPVSAAWRSASARPP